MRGFITAFNGLTLDDGVNRFAQSIIIPNKTANWMPLNLANGQIYDPLGGYSAPTVPTRFDAWFRFRFASADLLQSEFSAIAAKIGTSGTLTLSMHDLSATMTCTARLIKLQRPYASNVSTQRSDRLILTFHPTTDWS